MTKESGDQLLEQAREVLQRGRRSLDPVRAAELQRALDDAIARRRPVFDLRWVFVGAAIAACAAAILFAPQDGSEPRPIVEAIERGRAVAMSRGERIELQGATVQARGEARLELESLTPDEVRIDLSIGSVEVEVAESVERFVLTTPLAEMTALSSRFSVTAGAERTDVRVSRGALTVADRRSGEVVRVSSGRTYSVEREVEVTEAPPPTVKPAGQPAASKPRARRREVVAVEAVAPVERAEIEKPRREQRQPEEQPQLEEQPPGEETPPISPPAVIAPAPEPIEALVKRADSARRGGDPAAAAALYSKIAAHPDGAPFAEEALFRAAELSARLERTQAALRALADAERRFEGGELQPERSALAARIHLDLGDPRAAGRALLRLPTDRATLEVSMVALEVARALETDHPCDALSVSPLVHDPAELRAGAEALAVRARDRCERSP